MPSTREKKLSVSPIFLSGRAAVTKATVQCFQRDNRECFTQHWDTTDCLDLEGRGADRGTFIEFRSNTSLQM